MSRRDVSIVTCVCCSFRRPRFICFYLTQATHNSSCRGSNTLLASVENTHVFLIQRDTHACKVNIIFKDVFFDDGHMEIFCSFFDRKFLYSKSENFKCILSVEFLFSHFTQSSSVTSCFLCALGIFTVTHTAQPGCVAHIFSSSRFENLVLQSFQLTFSIKKYRTIPH